MRVVIAEPGNPAEVREISSDMETLQKLVGGYVECLPCVGYDVMFNEEGIRLNLAANRVVMGNLIVGTIVVTKHDRAGDPIALDEQEAAEVVHRLDNWPPSMMSVAPLSGAQVRK